MLSSYLFETVIYNQNLQNLESCSWCNLRSRNSTHFINKFPMCLSKNSRTQTLIALTVF